VKTLRRILSPIAGLGLLVLLLFGVDRLFPPYYHHLFVLFGINIILTVSLNITNGFTGLFSLGHGGLMLAAGYASAYLTMPVWWKAAHLSLPSWLTNAHWPFFLALIVGGLVATLFGFVLTAPSFRLKGHYFMLMTLGFNIIMVSVGENLIAFTNGAKGMCPIPTYTNLWWVFGIVAFLVYFVLRLKRSKLGRAMIAVGKDQTLAETMGISASRAKMAAFAISSFFTGVGGVLLVHVIGNLFPTHFGLDIVFDVVMMLIIGGMGSVTGSILGAAIVTGFVELLSPIQEGFTLFGFAFPRMFGLVQLLFAVALILILVFRPYGIMGERELSLRSLGNAARFVGRLIRPRRSAA
jgi:branched-chain amino acid transport system permease protein